MTQATDWGVQESGPATPTEVTERMNDSLNALLSTQKGSSAPSYKLIGTIWLDDSASPWALKLWDNTNWIIFGYFDPTGHTFQPLSSGGITDIASATTTDLNATTARINITGTTTITGFGSAAPTGAIKYVKFAGALVLTYNASSLILPGAANITTVANDEAAFVHLGSGNWKCLYYQRNDGTVIALATSANIWAKVTNKMLTPGNAFAAAAFQSLTDAATITPDFAAGFNFKVTLGGNRTLANPSNQTEGQSGTIRIQQDGTGSRTLAYGTNWKWVGGVAPTLSTAAGAVDMLTYQVTGTGEIFASLTKGVA